MRIGEKIEEFGKKKFGPEHGWRKRLAEAVDKSYADLYNYLGPNPRSMPGAPLLKKLYDLGCDLNWLFTDENIVKEEAAGYASSKELLDEIENLKIENAELKKKLNKIGKLFE